LIPQKCHGLFFYFISITGISDFFCVEGKVIIIIGGDDNYRSEDEEDRVVISRWAKRKISSQFSEEFLDGRKSFIFSWNKKHREIHEEALLHFFGVTKEGQKFEYQPKPKQLGQSTNQQRGKEGTGSSNSSSAEERRKEFASGPSHKTARTSSESTLLHEDHSMNEQRGEANRTAAATYNSEHGAKSKETPSASTGTTKVTGEGWRGI